MRCWICGDQANSGEHLVKASDLRGLFGHVTQRAPLYLHTSLKRNQPIGGIKSDKLKYPSLLCSRCNNERTQPHDRAWERLSDYLRSRQPKIQAGSLIRLNKVFPGSVSNSMRCVHLFFVKLFGCLIAKHRVPIDLGQFSQAILNETPHPKVWLAFWTGLQHPTIKSAGHTPINAAKLNGQVAFATWFYVVDNVAVNVMYAEPAEHRMGLVHAWHPSSTGKRLRIVGR